MKKDRIYIDTSIVGGYFDVEFEFEFETNLLFERLEKKRNHFCYFRFNGHRIRRST
jgi:hypothetical protein